MITMQRPPAMNPGYLAMVRGTRELHQLLAAGKEDSPEADAIRDATDGPWEALSEVERNRIRNLSEDLYSLTEPPRASEPMTAQAQAGLNEAYEARQRGEWDRALDLLRRWRAHIDPALVSYLRGSIWLGAGDAATAALFVEHAHKLRPENENYLALFLYALAVADAPAAGKLAKEILREHAHHSPAVVSRAADVEFTSATAVSETEAHRVFARLKPILQSALARFDEQDPSRLDRSSYVMTLGLLGFGYEFLGDRQAALQAYSRALQLDPHNDAFLVARGVLLYGASPRAVADLETAVHNGSSRVWPYVLLAHHCLLNGRFEQCRKLCEQTLDMDASAPVRSEVAEWLAIAEAALGYPAEIVRASLDRAIRLDPSNDRARRNLAAFETAAEPIAVKNWETRSAAAVRTSGLAERRFHGVA